MDYNIKGSPTQALIATSLGFFFGFAAVALFGPTAKLLSNVMELTPSQVGILIAIPTLSGSLLRIPFSAFVDRNGGRKPFLILLFLAFIGVFGLAVLFSLTYPDKISNRHYPLLILFGILSGCGIATFSVGTSQVSYWFPKKRQGWALGIFGGLGNLGPGVFTILLPIALVNFSLPTAYIIWTIIVFIGFIIYLLIGQNPVYFQLLLKGVSKDNAISMARNYYSDKNKQQENFPKGGIVYTLITSAKNIKTWVLMLLYFITFGGFMALTSWSNTFWQAYYELSITTAGLLAGGYAILASVMRVPGGIIADKFGGIKTSQYAILIFLIGSIIVFTGNTIYITILGFIVMAIGMGLNNASVFKMVPDFIPEAIGGASGWIGGIGALGGFILPIILSKFVSVYDNIGYKYGFLIYIIAAFIAILLIIYLYLSQKK